MNPHSIIWDRDLVEEWLQTATQVERVLPPVKPGTRTSSMTYYRTWVEMLWDELDPDNQPRPVFQPTNAQISMWEEVALRWLPLVDSTADRKILWWRSAFVSWVKIGKRLDIERHTVANRYNRAIDELVKALNSPRYKNAKRNT